VDDLPRPWRFSPPTPAEIAEYDTAAAEFRARQAAHAAARDAERPLRLQLLALGPQLRDVDAAADCRCSCHPTPPGSLHEGGVRCPCQLTVEERRAAVADFFERHDALHSDADHLAARAAADAHLAAAIAELEASGDVTIDQCGGAAPFVITGSVAGRGFYLRERHDRYRVVVAPDDDPAIDIWSAPPSTGHIVVAAGDADAFVVAGQFDPAVPLRYSVDAVRLFLSRRTCSHDGAARFCPTCGVEMCNAARWRTLEI
jgi:hypothetical protein